jgi:hypothetical protein
MRTGHVIPFDRLRRIATAAWVTVEAIGAGTARAQTRLPDQSFELMPEIHRATVGDTVTLRVRLRLDERDLLYDTVPKATDAPPGVRVLSVEKLQRGADRIFTGRIRVAFYRTGRQAAPVFGLDFMRGVKGITRGTLKSDSAFVEIDPVASAGNPPLKDIKQIQRRDTPDPLLLGIGLGALASAAAADRVRRRRQVPRIIRREAPPALPVAVTPYELALRQLVELEAMARAPGADLAACVEAVANVLRDYIAGTTAIPARPATTGELLASLPERLSPAGLGDGCGAVLRAADLIKFAQAGANADQTLQLVRDTQALLEEWHALEKSL